MARGATTLSGKTLSITTFSIALNDTQHNVSVVVLSVIYVDSRKQTHNTKQRYAECRCAECHYSECRGSSLEAYRIRLEQKHLTASNTLAYCVPS